MRRHSSQKQVYSYCAVHRVLAKPSSIILQSSAARVNKKLNQTICGQMWISVLVGLPRHLKASCALIEVCAFCASH